MMCCPLHHHQRFAPAGATQPLAAHCHENAAAHSIQCDLTCANSTPDYGLTALMLPAFPLTLASVAAPPAMRATLPSFTAPVSLGFPDQPQQPPRA